jgi:hypothetical protein
VQIDADHQEIIAHKFSSRQRFLAI